MNVMHAFADRVRGRARVHGLIGALRVDDVQRRHGRLAVALLR